MPYITQDQREYIDRHLHSILFQLKELPYTVGELNYIITKLMIALIKEKNYTQMNNIIGAMECAKLEFYRRMVAPYEDKKIKENGDVY